MQRPVQPTQRRVPRWRAPAPAGAARVAGVGAGIDTLTQAMGRMAFGPSPVPLARRAPRVAPLRESKSQTATLAAAVQRPRAADDDVALLLGPETNGVYCPVESIETAQGKAIAAGTNVPGTVYGRILGAGTNARVYALVWPAAARDVPGFAGIDAPLAIKIPTSAIAASSVVAQAGAFMAALPCWDRRRGDYACPIEVEAEALLSALASGLFVDGITPGAVVQMRAFVCPGPASERALCLVQERLGVDTGAGAYVSTVERLPLFLDLVEGRPTGGLAGRVRRIESAAVEVCVSVLHTLAVMQAAFGLNVLDVRPANLLLKVLTPGARYFRGADTAAASAFMLAWPSTVVAALPRRPTAVGVAGGGNGGGNGDAPGGWAGRDNESGLFVLPNRGWLVKVADMGMAAAYRVARLEPLGAAGTDGARASVATTVVVGTERSSERVAAVLDRRAADARTVYDAARARALDAGYSPTEASAAASAALSDDQVEAIVTLAQRLDERCDFGIEPRFVPGYDAHTLVAAMADACTRWIGRVPPPIALLRDTLGYDIPAEGGGRPAPGSVSRHGPLDALDALYDAARAGRGDAGTYMAAYLPRGPDPRAVLVEVPAGPVLLSDP
ncbi:hypothetical protein psal_cds_303 [Pandoravirus salinus]|uniref:Protein kinase domain-containing protein n=1 Tax=Pandoravirus salinus TaxID=1349410 RepID=S4W1A4_9VIRU|nr:hypothetical protein psal_cds_303 [Pandoravirus salinus]AGO83905.1 hypothetical protein psal_cds_303 [Pandoravirus salinus]